MDAARTVDVRGRAALLDEGVYNACSLGRMSTSLTLTWGGCVTAYTTAFTLSEIEQCLQKWDSLSLAERREIILDKMTQIDRRMAEMEQMKAYLKTLMPPCLADRGC